MIAGYEWEDQMSGATSSDNITRVSWPSICRMIEFVESDPPCHIERKQFNKIIVKVNNIKKKYNRTGKRGRQH